MNLSQLMSEMVWTSVLFLSILRDCSEPRLKLSLRMCKPLSGNILSGQPRRMSLRMDAECDSPKRLEDYHLYARYCRLGTNSDLNVVPEEEILHSRDVKI